MLALSLAAQKVINPTNVKNSYTKPYFQGNARVNDTLGVKFLYIDSTVTFNDSIYFSNLATDTSVDSVVTILDDVVKKTAAVSINLSRWTKSEHDTARFIDATDADTTQIWDDGTNTIFDNDNPVKFNNDVVISTNLLPDADDGANIGATATRFNLGWFDTVHAAVYDGTAFTLGSSGSDITINSDSIEGEPVWKGAFKAGTITSDGIVKGDSLISTGGVYGDTARFLSYVGHSDFTIGNTTNGVTSLVFADGTSQTTGSSASADSVYQKITAYDTLRVGYTVPNEQLPVLELYGDADSDVGNDVTEVFTITLDPHATPTNSIWDFTSTQGLGYRFDKDLHVENIETTTGTTFSSVLDYTYISDNDIKIQADRLEILYQSDVLTGMPAAFEFGYPGTNWELVGTDEQSIMSIKGRVNKESGGNYIGLLLDALETSITGSNDELMALRIGGVDKFTISNTGFLTFVNGAVIDNTDADTLEITEAVVKITGGLVVTGNPYCTQGFADSMVTITIGSADVYYPITNGANTLYTPGVNFGDLVQAGDSIQIVTSGNYELTWDLSYSGGNTDEFHVEWWVNNVGQEGKGEAIRDMTTGKIGHSGATTILSLTATHWVVLMVKNDNNGNDIEVISGNITIKKL